MRDSVPPGWSRLGVSDLLPPTFRSNAENNHAIAHEASDGGELVTRSVMNSLRRVQPASAATRRPPGYERSANDVLVGVRKRPLVEAAPFDGRAVRHRVFADGDKVVGRRDEFLVVADDQDLCDTQVAHRVDEFDEL